MLPLVLKIVFIIPFMSLALGQENSLGFTANPIWAQELNNITLPDIPRKKVGEGTCPDSKCVPGECETCWESCGSCPGENDIFGCKNSNHWALTFDDGPTTLTTDLLLALDRLNIKATFFVLGKNVQQFPQLLKSIHEHGHEIGSHTWSHSHLMSLSNEEIVAEVRATEEEIFKVTQVKPKYIRAPYGEIDGRVRGILTALGYEIVFWNIDTQDWKLRGNDYIQDEKNLLESFQKNHYNSTDSNGFISLQHEFLPITAQILPKIQETLQKGGFDLVSLDECLERHPQAPAIETESETETETLTRVQDETKTESIVNDQEKPVEEDPNDEDFTDVLSASNPDEFEITKIPTFIDDLSESQHLVSSHSTVTTPKSVIFKVFLGFLVWRLLN